VVSREQRLVITLAMLALPAFAKHNPKRFVRTIRCGENPRRKREVDDLGEFLLNSFVVPRREEKLVRHGAHKALDANTLGEVPRGCSRTCSNRNRRDRRKRELLPANPPDRSRSARRWRRVSALDDGACRMDSCAASCTLGKGLSHNTAELESHVP
jgi:hypothetical protein